MGSDFSTIFYFLSQPLERDSVEFKNILDYACKTHASTHDQYTLIIEDIFKIERQGTKKCYPYISIFLQIGKWLICKL